MAALKVQDAKFSYYHLKAGKLFGVENCGVAPMLSGPGLSAHTAQALGAGRYPLLSLTHLTPSVSLQSTPPLISGGGRVGVK